MFLIGNILCKGCRAIVAFPYIENRLRNSIIFGTEKMYDSATITDGAGSMMYVRMHELKMNTNKKRIGSEPTLDLLEVP